MTRRSDLELGRNLSSEAVLGAGDVLVESALAKLNHVAARWAAAAVLAKPGFLRRAEEATHHAAEAREVEARREMRPFDASPEREPSGGARDRGAVTWVRPRERAVGVVSSIDLDR